MTTINNIKKLEKKQTFLLNELQCIHYMIRGSYGKSYRRCGKPTCWCNKDNKGHPSYRISWTKDSKSRTKAVPKEDIGWIKEMTRNYRTLTKKLRKLYNELRNLLNNLEDEVIRKTEKLRDYF